VRTDGGRLFHTSGPQTEKARLPNWVRVLCIAAALVEMVKMKSSKDHSKKQETQLSLTNRTTRLEVSQGHQTIRYVRHGFLLVCYSSNFVPKTRLF